MKGTHSIKNKTNFSTILIFILVLLSLSCKRKNTDPKTVAASTDMAKPNIIYILADDLGYAEVGAYGQEKNRNPEHAGHAFIRGNDPWAGRGDVQNSRAVESDSTLEGQRPMPDSTVTFA